MREILFRGKRKENGKWIYGSLVPKETNSYADGFLIIDGALNYDELDNYYPSFSTYDVVSETVGQYTGLTDKNGKKIFEGDILKNIESNEIVAICYGGCSFCYSYNGTIYGIDDSETGLEMNEWEIIGNIHDNPELLEV